MKNNFRVNFYDLLTVRSKVKSLNSILSSFFWGGGLFTGLNLLDHCIPFLFRLKRHFAMNSCQKNVSTEHVV